MAAGMAAVTAAILIGALTAPLLHAQSPAAVTDRPAFEVATIKPDTGASGMIRIQIAPGGRLNAENVTVRILLGYAYDVRDYQISGAPSWAGSQQYDVVAKSEKAAPPTEMRLMMQSLLADRFKLAFHRETKTDAPVYELTPARGGLKLTASTAGSCVTVDRDHPPAPPPPGGPIPNYCGNIRMGRGRIDAWGIPMTRLIETLSNILGRAIVDKTGATGTYNFHLEYTPDQATAGGLGALPGPGGRAPGTPALAPPPDSASPDIFTALQEQLGVRAQSSKGPVEMLVIDRLERPSEN